jgi:hypothetical protein
MRVSMAELTASSLMAGLDGSRSAEGVVLA